MKIFKKMLYIFLLISINYINTSTIFFSNNDSGYNLQIDWIAGRDHFLKTEDLNKGVNYTYTIPKYANFFRVYSKELSTVCAAPSNQLAEAWTGDDIEIKPNTNYSYAVKPGKCVVTPMRNGWTAYQKLDLVGGPVK